MKTQEEILKLFDEIEEDEYRELMSQIDRDRNDKKLEVLEIITYLFLESKEQIKERISSFWSQYKNSDGIVDVVASRKKLTESELIAFKKRIQALRDTAESENVYFDKDIIKQLDKIDKAKSIMRITALLYEIKVIIELLYGRVGKEYASLIKDVMQEFYLKTAFLIFSIATVGSKDFNKLTDKKLNELIQNNWRRDNVGFDEAHWNKKRTLEWELDTKINQSLHFGMDLDIITAILDNLFKSNLGYFKSTTNTDLTYYSTLAQREAFDYFDVEEALFVAVLDERTTEMCVDADGNRIPVDDIRPWENAPPLWYGCRSTLYPIIKEINWIDGDVYEMADYSFDTWYDEYLY